MRPTFAGDPQPHSSASETPRRIAPSATDKRGAEPVDARAVAQGKRRDQQVRGQRRGHRDQVDPEQPARAERVGDHAGQRQADAAADPEDRADHAQPGGDALARERVADDPERQGEHAARDPLDHASGDDDADRAAQDAHDRADTRTAAGPR